MAKGAAIREPHRPVLFALALLIHAGLFALLSSERHTRLESPERRTVLVFLPAPPPQSASLEVTPPAPPRLPETAPPSATAPELFAPRTNQPTQVPPAIDWRGDAEAIAREHARAAEAGREPEKDAPAKKKPEFAWSHSATHRIEPMENGGFVVWINDRCGVAVSGLAMPFCMFGKKPARGDLFEHMDDPPTPGDWKDE
ncbi:MAG TPA: hypothetical protein VJS12_17705 [Steroidobacteraceae bacterium]|nr:hypothetical protein [Steroidobacteraceae bacterium]